MAGEIHVGNTGLRFDAVVVDEDGPIDLSKADAIEMHFQKPDGSMLRVAATAVNGGSDGLVEYVTSPTDLDQDGTWRQQVYYAIGSADLYTNINQFKVFPNLPLEA